MVARVLLITPQFYGIEKKIKSVLEESDYEVIWIENKKLTLDYHGTKSKLKFLRKIYFILFSPKVRYVRKELKKIENTKFDILFSINTYIMCRFLFRELKKNNPELFSVLYLWDSFSMYKSTRDFKQFNKVISFDPEDSIKHQIEYKPNFHIKSNFKISPDHKYDLFFVGKFSHERLSVLDWLNGKSDIAGINSFIRLWPAYKIFLHNSLVYKFLRKLKLKSTWINNYILNYEAIEGIIKREYLLTKSLNFEEVQSILLSSNVILDLPFNGQTGYTHRLIGALANGKKVITTNSNIRKEKFYNPEQVHILNAQYPEIDYKWIKERYEFKVDIFFLNLELSVWLKSVLNVGIA